MQDQRKNDDDSGKYNKDDEDLGIVHHLAKDYKNNLRVSETMKGNGSLVEIEEYRHLRGKGAEHYYFSMKMGMRFKRIKITLNNASAICESGSLHYMEGNVTLDANIGGVGGLVKKKIQNKLTKETTIKPKFTGTGVVYLEPTWHYYALVYLNDETCVVDKGFYHACEGSVTVGVAMQKNFSAGLFGDQGWFQTKLTGTGWVVLATPVPPEEIQKFHLKSGKLQVEGDATILRKGDINFTVKKSTKGIVGSVASGEALLQTYEGTGEVWICPTLAAYNFGLPVHHV